MERIVLCSLDMIEIRVEKQGQEGIIDVKQLMETSVRCNMDAGRNVKQEYCVLQS